MASIRLKPVAALFTGGGPVLVLADLDDPANAGTLLRSADAFGAGGVVFGVARHRSLSSKGRPGVDGRRIATSAGGCRAFRTRGGGPSGRCDRLGSCHDRSADCEGTLARQLALVVGNERHGLGEWEALCERILSVPISGRAESLSAGVAGSIALYQATLGGVLE